MRPDARERFWRKVNIGTPDECWEWRAGRAYNAGRRFGGYGQFSVGTRKYVASRFAWMLTNGSIPDGLCVLHTCDNPPCCNPAHLFTGTRRDNARDSAAKGRTNRDPKAVGELNGNCKLTVADVAEIRRLYAAQVGGYRTIAKSFDVSYQQIKRIVQGTHWRAPA